MPKASALGFGWLHPSPPITRGCRLLGQVLLHNVAPTRSLEGVAVQDSEEAEQQQQQADGGSVAGAEASKATSVSPEKGAPGPGTKPGAGAASQKASRTAGGFARSAGAPARKVASAIAGLATFTAGEVMGTHKRRTAASYAWLLERTLREVFGEDFSRMVPVYSHRKARAGLMLGFWLKKTWGVGFVCSRANCSSSLLCMYH